MATRLAAWSATLCSTCTSTLGSSLRDSRGLWRVTRDILVFYLLWTIACCF
jgi:hypothetical protein